MNLVTVTKKRVKASQRQGRIKQVVIKGRSILRHTKGKIKDRTDVRSAREVLRGESEVGK